MAAIERRIVLFGRELKRGIKIKPKSIDGGQANYGRCHAIYGDQGYFFADEREIHVMSPSEIHVIRARRVMEDQSWRGTPIILKENEINEHPELVGGKPKGLRRIVRTVFRYIE